MKKKFIMTIMLVIISISISIAQPTFDWATKMNCNLTIGAVGSIKVDKQGNTFVLGSFQGSIVFPTGVISQPYSSLDPFLYGVFLAKYNPQGDAIWGYKINGSWRSSIIQPFDMDVDSMGNVYTSILNFISKYDSSGTIIWNSGAIGLMPNQSGFGFSQIKLNKQQNELLITGQVDRTCGVDFGNGVIVNLSNPSLAFVVHYNTGNGNAIRGEKLTALTNTGGIAVANDGSSFIFSGYTVLKLNNNDSTIWSKNITAEINDVATDGDNCFIVGNFSGGIVQMGTLTATSNYTTDFYYAKISSMGQPVFLKAGAIGISGNATAEEIAFDKNKSFYILGNGVSTVGNPSYAITSPNEHYILRYDTLGNTIWGGQFNTNIYTSNVITNKTSFTISDSLHVFVSGVYNPTAHFGSDSLLNSFSTRDAFISKLRQCFLATPIITSNGTTTFCVGNSINLTCSTAPNYLWNTAATAQTINISTSGTYSVTVSNSLGCTASSLPVTVIVNPNPPTPTINKAENILASSSATNNQWYCNDTLIAGATSQIYSVPTSLLDTACYTVVVSNGVGCTSTSLPTCYNPTSVGINENVNSNIISIYPNPTSGQFTILLPTDNAEIAVTNILGHEIIKTKTIQKTTNLQLSENGAYIVYIKTKKGITIRKLIVNH